MNCDDVRNRLADYLGQELSSEDRHRVDAHLLDCQSCRREISELGTVLVELRGREGVTVNAARERTQSINLQPRARSWTIRLLRAAALLLVGAGIGWIVRGAGSAVSDNQRASQDARPHSAIMASGNDASSLRARYQNVDRDFVSQSSFVRNLSAAMRPR